MFKAKKIEKKDSLKPLSLRKNISWTFMGNIIYAGCQWGMLVVLAKLGSPEMVGRFALALAITAPVMMLTNLQLRGVQATDTKELYQFGDYLGLRLITSMLAFFIVAVVVLLTNRVLETIFVVLIMCMAKIIESISDIVFGLMQKNECMDRIAMSMIFKGVISLLVLGIVVWITSSLVVGTLALALVWFAVLVFYDVKNAQRFTTFRPIIHYPAIKSMVKLSLPLGIVLMMGSLNTNIPRYFIEFYIDEETLGYFAAMAYLIVAGNSVISALGQSATPKLAKYYAYGNRKSFEKLILKMVGIGIIMGVIGLGVAIIFGNELLTLLYSEDYAKYSDVFVLVMLAGAINYAGSFLGYGMTAARCFKIQPFLGSIWVISSLVVSFLLIPSYGMRGAAYVLIVSSCVQLVTKTLVVVYLIYIRKADNYVIKNSVCNLIF
ncbi:Membrane protein involved in the export of O-antigen and teichoic acid [Desulfotomaculum arcticum]|uniref:Membrane protein involved in the export of O-antigen and teichoic acid n=1 Tax=Desulfotruncus arcticus DSM 17038 TaxID=1121424 RepID=A0A1I2X2K2_9FIRM|nr:oligosaccharide flippase family protein [Desulfotruncus arcticus]SFH07672.1 Membrane protein involved in the export of O-antigen and teichoic acid [Desulfotomaculum arcticum] [Desulfotruncus arcticus DSM 17038]